MDILKRIEESYNSSSDKDHALIMIDQTLFMMLSGKRNQRKRRELLMRWGYKKLPLAQCGINKISQEVKNRLENNQEL